MKELVVKLRVDGSGAFPAFATLEKRVSNLATSGFGNLKSAIVGAFSVGAITAFTRSTINWGGAVSDVATRLGVTAEYVQEMTYALEQAGSNMNELVQFTEQLNKLRAMAGQGGASGERILSVMEGIGVSREAMLGSSAQPVIDAIAAAFKRGNADEITAQLGTIGMRSAGRLATAFAEGIEEKRERIRAAGGIVSDDVIAQLDAIGDSMATLSTVLRAEFAPAVVETIRAVLDSINWLRQSAAFVGGGTAGMSKSDYAKAAYRLGPMGRLEAATIGKLGIKSLPGYIAGESNFDFEAAGQAQQEVAERFKKIMDSLLPKSGNAKTRARGAAWQGPPWAGAGGMASETGRITGGDALTNVGNFLGAGRSVIESIGKETNQLLKGANERLDRIADSIGAVGTLGLPET